MKRNARKTKRRGAMIVLVAVTLIIFLIAVVFSVEVAYMQLARTELRSSVDAATRAGAEALSRDMSTTAAIARAQEVALLNPVNGVGLTLPEDDILFGRVSVSQSGISAFVPGGTPPNAIQITTGRTADRPDGTVPLLLGSMLGVSSFAPVQTATAAQLDRDLTLVLDRSGSMSSSGKFDALKAAVDVFLDEIDLTPQTEHVSIVVYDNSSQKIQELTPSTASCRTAMEPIVTGGGTAIGLGLEEGINSLLNDTNRRPFAEPTIVLMTDGRHNTAIDPEDVILTAPADFKVHTVTFGSGADQVRMEELAETRSGKHFHAPDNAALIAIFREIGATLPVVMTK